MVVRVLYSVSVVLLLSYAGVLLHVYVQRVLLMKYGVLLLILVFVRVYIRIAPPYMYVRECS